MALLVDVSDVALSAIAVVSQRHALYCRPPGVATYRCIVMPHPLRSLTRSTLLITSLPRLSNTSTFHMGSPSAFKMGVD